MGRQLVFFPGGGNRADVKDMRERWELMSCSVAAISTPFALLDGRFEVERVVPTRLHVSLSR